MSSEDKSIYLGLWTNWSHGSVIGLTYTTTLDNGGLFIAFLALFVAFTGTCFWSIISFTVHQILSRPSPQNAIYHQQQAILRSSDTSSAALWRLIRLSWAWRKISCAASLKATSVPLVASLLTFTAFTAAGIFSSRVASSRGSEVLVIGNNCATVNGSLITKDNIAMTQYYIASRVRSSLNYKANCYSGSDSTELCRTFVRNSLSVTVTRSDSCPFAGKDAICRKENGAIRIDSGYLNSHHDLGINAPPSSRFLYRTVNECAPIRGAGYARFNTTSVPKTMQLLYGSNQRVCPNTENCTMTFGYGVRVGSTVSRNQYTVTAATRWQVTEELSYLNEWEPIPELEVPNADISALFLEINDVFFSSPVADPWYNAQAGPRSGSTGLGNTTFYYSDQMVRTLGCAQQYQFCNPSLPKNISCTPLMGIFEASRLAETTLFTDPKTRNTFHWSSLAIMNMANGFNELITILRGGALLASDTLSGVGQFALPDNQWELELEHWFKTTLADLQRAVLDQATGPADKTAASFHSGPTTAEARAVCQNQKILSDSYTSFNVLGIILIFSIGGLIVLISAILPSATAHLQKKRNPFANLEWVSNDTLQLQRLAHEAVGAGEWKGACDDYPRTRKNDLLAVLDVADRKHPVLRVAPRAADTMETVVEEQHYGVQKEDDSMRTRTYDSAQTSLLNVEIPRTSLQLSRRFTDDVC
ncbi:hypothetical protein COCCADRAFT_2352 [Bipolaris zeicola 26-R-13]|uniref:Uncharacterized protein n=1 Tax=Cochliobolus carbonum (strain 26-R-13) TaxID=930089 RepID=W6YLF5_COCC2|nr:uncharacterized protein COCCADRAFT_2352 [Bipolaris zeicola 26-R-13]EUC36514.1 hypothetical protein COCCADRAFT_2352 [Bipolaris zeicola 26-R-13]